MKKFVALLMKEKWQRMNGKMVTPTFFEFYRICIKKLGQFFSILYSLYIVLLRVINILKVNKWSMKTLALGSLKILCIRVIPLINL